MQNVPHFEAHYECFLGCEGTFALDEVIYTCPKCGGLLDVVHDLSALQSKSGVEWRALLDRRFSPAQMSGTSGVWRQKEWVLPEISDDNIASLGEGNGYLFQSPAFSKAMGIDDIFVKQCGHGHTGSFKDLGMTILVSAVKQMIAGGKKIQAVVCASTGDTSAALAAYCAAAEIPAVVLLPENKISTAQLTQPIANGAKTFSLQTDFDGCMRIVKELTQEPTIYLANSMNALRIEGQKTIAIEICQQLGWQAPDWVVVPGGNLGNISAIGKGFSLAHDLGLVDKKPRLVCAQTEAANPLYESFKNGFTTFSAKTAGETAASAIRIGDPVSVHKAIHTLRKFDGIVEQASEEELAEAATQADRTGLFTCPQTAVALAATKKLALKNKIKKSEKVVVVSTAHGLKFTEFKTRLHQQGAANANFPVSLPAKTEAVLEALHENESSSR